MDYETIWESEIHIEENNLPCVIVEKDNTYKGKNKYMVYEYARYHSRVSITHGRS